MTVIGGGWFWFFLRVDVYSEAQPWYRIIQADLFVLALVASAFFGLVWSYLRLHSIAINSCVCEIEWSQYNRIFDSKINLIGDTYTLDLDPRSFSQRLDIVEMDVTSKEEENVEEEKEDTVYKNNNLPLTDILIDYTSSPEFGKSFTFTKENYDKNFNDYGLRNNNIIKTLT